jgi:hypothetical protein
MGNLQNHLANHIHGQFREGLFQPKNICIFRMLVKNFRKDQRIIHDPVDQRGNIASRESRV